MPIMYRWILAVSAGIVLGLIAVSTSSGAIVAIAILLAVVLLAAIDILTLPRASGQRVGSVDLLWAFATLAFFPWGSIAWALFGRPVRRREHERQAAADELAMSR